MRPLWSEFPSETNIFAIDDQHLVGSSIMVKPITDQGATSVQVIFPGENEVRFNLFVF